MKTPKNMFVQRPLIPVVTEDSAPPDVPTLVYIEAVMLPNGEVIRYGKTIPWHKNK